ncbi:MAG: hypothetical protein AB1635_06280 [Acidobacteriota bacterium]
MSADSLLLATLVFGLVGTGVELSLIGHYEDALQLVPLALIAAALAASAWRAAAPDSSPALRVFQALMAALIVAGAAGAVLHFRGSMEFQLEMDPSLAGFDLAMKVLQAKSPPTLAPGSMAVLGLVGIASTLRRPS